MANTSKKSSLPSFLSFIEDINPNVKNAFIMLLVAGISYYFGVLSTEVKFYRDNLLAPSGIGNNLNNPSAGLPSADDGPLENAEVALPTADEHIRGNPDARIALVEYSDFDCPFCSQFHETAQEVVDAYPEDVMWVYRHFPLESIHPEALDKAIASECVASLGGSNAFWDFADLMFGNNGYTADDISEVAGQVGVGESALSECMAGDLAADAVDEDLGTATIAGVQGTPGNFLVDMETGEAITLYGAVPFSTVENAIESLQ